METKRILVVDDEQEMRTLLTICLQPHQFLVQEAASGEEAIHILMESTFDLVLLDIMMPGMDGFDVLKEIRQDIDEDLPVILLTALGDSEKIVSGLQLGGDDYIVKPFEPKELVARVEAVLRRTKRKVETSPDSFHIHDLMFYPNKAKVSYLNEAIPLTKKELNLLIRLATNPGRVFSREHLLELEWDDFYEGDQRTVDAHIKNIREKLKSSGYPKAIIETIWGIGYQMIEES
ncbi:response regulator transcription factor [Alkalihalobacillus sp. LMS39]|nr:response regulator transcription factor [Alkalihalobacillus sp. LMS39]UOE96452.1 response regulator transcription factor [Alkalihalobacillus sp. LMS39]